MYTISTIFIFVFKSSLSLAFCNFTKETMSLISSVDNKLIFYHGMA